MFTFDSRKPLVLGLGCDAVADDGFGPAVAAALKADPLVRARADVACLTWSGPERRVDQLVHIHGDKDRLMPIGSIKDPVVISGGTHFMVFNKAGEVARAVNDALLRVRPVSSST